MSRVLALRVDVDRLTCRYQLTEEASSNGVVIGNLTHGGISDVVMQHTKRLLPQLFEKMNCLIVF